MAKLDYWIITSLLDTDLYKFTMLQAFYHAPEFREIDVEWKFKCRNLGDRNLAGLIPEIQRQLEHVCQLHFQDEELTYLDELSYIKRDFVEFLRLYKLDMKFVRIDPRGNDLSIRIKGPLIHVVMFEIYTLAIISELYSTLVIRGVDAREGRRRLSAKIYELHNHGDTKGLKIADFSTRRRASKAWQYEVLNILKREIPDVLVGTSNVQFARELGLTPIGTMAHEWFQAWQAVTRLADAQKAALEGWVREYRGALGVALTDCYNMEAFSRDFDLYFGKLFDGLRHDSGCPFEWGEKAIALYESLGLDPGQKTLVFSDGLDFSRMLDIYDRFRGRTNMAFGIGTNLGNDVGFEPLNIVIKMVRANNRPVAKVSDEPGKNMCEDIQYLRYLASVYDIDPETVQVSE